MIGPLGTPSARRWINCLRRRDNPSLSLVAFPFAGAGTLPFRSWAGSLPPWIELHAICLPGRENRTRDPFVTDPSQVVAEITTEIETSVAGPLVFFGHSLGAVLAFEVARALRRQTSRAPVHLWVSSRPAPHLDCLKSDGFHVLSDEELTVLLRDMGGTPPELFDDPEWLAFMLPLARADLTLHSSYRYAREDPLALPITAFGGESDPWVSREQLAGWQQHTISAFELRMFLGDHFYLSAQAKAVTTAIVETLERSRY